MGHQIVNEDAEEIKLKAPEGRSLFSRKPAESSEFSASCRKLRVFMNKVTDENYQKLLNDLTETVSFDEKLLIEYLRLVFDRASKSFSELYQKIILYFSFVLKKQGLEKHVDFIGLLNDKSRTAVLGQTEAEIGTLRLVGHLYVEKAVDRQVIIEYFEKLENIEIKLEGICTLLLIVSPYLVTEEEQVINQVFSVIGKTDCQNFNRKLQFLVQGILEKETFLKTPAEFAKSFSPEDKKNKKVSFVMGSDFQPVVSNKTKRILKHSVPETVKERIRTVVCEYVKGNKVLEPFEKIFEECKTQQRQLVNQIFKYALIYFNREQEFLIICEMICEISVGIVGKDVIETGIAYTIEAVEDIKLDTPMAHLHLEFIIRYLKRHGIIEDDEYLLRHLTCPILRESSDSGEGVV